MSWRWTTSGSSAEPLRHRRHRNRHCRCQIATHHRRPSRRRRCPPARRPRNATWLQLTGRACCPLPHVVGQLDAAGYSGEFECSMVCVELWDATTCREMGSVGIMAANIWCKRPAPTVHPPMPPCMMRPLPPSLPYPCSARLEADGTFEDAMDRHPPLAVAGQPGSGFQEGPGNTGTRVKGTGTSAPATSGSVTRDRIRAM